MGFFDNLKKGAKSYAEDYKKTSAENKKYKKEVNEAVKKARRETYKKEAIVQARLKGKILAKQKFNPSPQASGGGGMTPEARALIYGSGFSNPKPSQQVVQRIQQTRSKKKKKKGSKPKTIIKYIQQPKTERSAMDRLLYDS